MANVQDPLAVTIPPLATQVPNITSPSSIGLNKLSMHSRHHSLGTNPSMHRVTRRKSVSSSATNLAAVAQAVKDGADVPLTLPPPNNTSGLSRSMGRNAGLGHSPIQQSGAIPPVHGYPSPPSSLPNNGGAGPLVGVSSLPSNGFTFPRKVPVPSPSPASSGITTAAVNGSSPTVSAAPTNGRRVRRASEGAHVLLGGEGPEGSSGSGRGGKSGVELKCDKCGKGYKHSSCLTKHLWEHTPEWALTSKLLISKHQQVQLLEAASILVSMNPNPSPAASSTSLTADGNPTPAISASSGANSIINDGHSSGSASGSEDTPPPTDRNSSAASVTDLDLSSPLPTPRSARARSGSKRHHGGSLGTGVSKVSGYGLHHAAQPAPLLAGSVPTHINPGSNFPSHFVNRPYEARRPRAGSFVHTTKTASAAAAAQAAADEESLAAAVELLSCSFGAAPSGSTPIITPRQGLGSPPTLGLNTPTGLTSPVGFLEQLRMQARSANGVGAENGDVVMKIEETEEEDEQRSETSGYYTGEVNHRENSRGRDDEMAVDDDEDEEMEWEGRRRGSTVGVHTRSMRRRERRKSDEEEDHGVFGKMEE